MRDQEPEDQAALIQTLKQQSIELDEVTFCARHEGHYLLGRLPTEAGDEWSFATDVRMFGAGPGRGSILRDTPTGDRVLWKVEKTDRNTWKRRISIGRTRNNDVIIRHHSVSKLHAHFHFGMLAKLRSLSPSAELMLSDAGSSNGTAVDGRRLAEGDVVPVGTGSRIQLGSVQCQLLDAKALYQTLRSILV
jgi:hypothetical protein